MVVTQRTLQDRVQRLSKAQPSVGSKGSLLISAEARHALAKEYAASGLMDEVAAEQAINNHIRTLGTAKVLADREITTYRIEFTGMYCQKETSSDGFLSDSDEPYFIFSSVFPTIHTSWTQNTGIYNVHDGIDSGDNWGPIPGPFYIAGQNGQPFVGMPFTCIVQSMEHDEGDPNAYRQEVETVVKAASAITKLFGISVPETVQKIITDVVNDLLGTGDDKLGIGSFSLDQSGLEYFSQQPLISFTPPGKGTNWYHIPVLCEGGGAKYWTFFKIEKIAV